MKALTVGFLAAVLSGLAPVTDPPDSKEPPKVATDNKNTLGAVVKALQTKGLFQSLDDGAVRQGTGRTRDHAFAALHAARLPHCVVEIEADAGRVAFAGATNHLIFHHIIACPDAPIAQNACAVIDGEHRR